MQGGRQIGYDCLVKPVPYRREGSLLILTIDPNDFGTPPSLARPLVVDTLEVAPGRLFQLTEPPNLLNPAGRTWRLEYVADEPPAERCVGAPAPP